MVLYVFFNFCLRLKSNLTKISESFAGSVPARRKENEEAHQFVKHPFFADPVRAL